jgi:hypothetical protein
VGMLQPRSSYSLSEHCTSGVLIQDERSAQSPELSHCGQVSWAHLSSELRLHMSCRILTELEASSLGTCLGASYRAVGSSQAMLLRTQATRRTRTRTTHCHSEPRTRDERRDRQAATIHMHLSLAEVSTARTSLAVGFVPPAAWRCCRARRRRIKPRQRKRSF